MKVRNTAHLENEEKHNQTVRGRAGDAEKDGWAGAKTGEAEGHLSAADEKDKKNLFFHLFKEQWEKEENQPVDENISEESHKKKIGGIMKWISRFNKSH